MQKENSKYQVLKKQINAWSNRAAMAKQQGSDDLVRQALDQKRKYENELAKLQEFELDSGDEK